MFAEKFVLVDDSVIRAKIIEEKSDHYIVLNNIGLIKIYKKQIKRIEELPEEYDYGISHESKERKLSIGRDRLYITDKNSVYMSPSLFGVAGDLDSLVSYGVSFALGFHYGRPVGGIDGLNFRSECGYTFHELSDDSFLRLSSLFAGVSYSFPAFSSEKLYWSAATLPGLSYVHSKKDGEESEGLSPHLRSTFGLGYIYNSFFNELSLQLDYLYDSKVLYLAYGLSLRSGVMF